MANVDVNGLDDFIDKLDAIDLMSAVTKGLEKAADVVANNMKSELAAHHDTGDLERSVKKRKVKRKEDGSSVFVGPSGTGKNGTRNMEKLAYLEYGTSKQSATPVIGKVVRKSETAIMQELRDAVEQGIGEQMK